MLSEGKTQRDAAQSLGVKDKQVMKGSNKKRTSKGSNAATPF
jgi:hypothetical protein